MKATFAALFSVICGAATFFGILAILGSVGCFVLVDDDPMSKVMVWVPLIVGVILIVVSKLAWWIANLIWPDRK